MPQAILFEEATSMTTAARPKPSTSYSKEEVLAAALEYFHNDELAATTWMNKYALRNTKGELIELTPADTHARMAREFARIERSYKPLPAEKQALLSTYCQKRKPSD